MWSDDLDYSVCCPCSDFEDEGEFAEDVGY